MPNRRQRFTYRRCLEESAGSLREHSGNTQLVSRQPRRTLGKSPQLGHSASPTDSDDSEALRGSEPFSARRSAPLLVTESCQVQLRGGAIDNLAVGFKAGVVAAPTMGKRIDVSRHRRSFTS